MYKLKQPKFKFKFKQLNYCLTNVSKSYINKLNKYYTVDI